MGGTIFSLGLAAGAFLLASWVDARVGESRRPESPMKRIGLCLFGVLVLQASVGGLYVVQAAGAPQAGLLAATFVLFLPALTFAMVTGIWLLRLLADIAKLARH